MITQAPDLFDGGTGFHPVHPISLHCLEFSPPDMGRTVPFFRRRERVLFQRAFFARDFNPSTRLRPIEDDCLVPFIRSGGSCDAASDLYCFGVFLIARRKNGALKKDPLSGAAAAPVLPCQGERNHGILRPVIGLSAER